MDNRLIEHLQRQVDALEIAHHNRDDANFEKALQAIRRALGEAWLNG